MTGPLTVRIRRRLYELVQAYPGIHVREAARQLETSQALVEYHVAVLVENGLLRVESNERYARMYAGPKSEGPTAAERRMLAVLRNLLDLQITLHLLDQGAAVAHKRLADDLDLGKSKLSFHLRKLEAAGIVRKRDGLFLVTDPRRLMRLLLEYRPTPDLREEFAHLWLSLYGERGD